MIEGILEYTWEDVAIGRGASLESRGWTVHLDVCYFGTAGSDAVLCGGPDNWVPGEAPEVEVVQVDVVGLRHHDVTVQVTSAHDAYWTAKFLREVVFEGKLNSALTVHATESRSL